MENNKIKKHSTRKTIVIIVSILALIIGYAILRTSYLEMKEIGNEYTNVFSTQIMYYCITFIINFVFLFLSFFFTNKQIKKSIKIFFDEEKKQMPKFPNKSVSFIIALIGSILSSEILLKNALLAFSNSKFGIKDPIFNYDISFFVLIKPFLRIIVAYLLIVIAATIAYAIIYSIIILNKSFETGVSRELIKKAKIAEKLSGRVKLIAILIGAFILLFMIYNIGNEKFQTIDLSDGSSLALIGASSGDATVKLAGYTILAFLAIISILRAFKAVKQEKLRSVVANLMIVPVYLIILAFVLAIYQWIFVGSNTLAKNDNYIKNNINYTQQAYGISSDETTIDYSGTITNKQIENNSEILNNIDVVSSENVLKDLENSKTSDGYYTYRQTQIEEYNIKGVNSLVYVTPREIETTNTSYKNKTYQYTHGYGAIITLAGQTDSLGNLKNEQNKFGDLSNEDIPITQPRIYYGLENEEACVINKDTTEIDYIDEDSNEETTYKYTGNAGLKLNFFDRLLIGIREKNLKLAFSTSVNSESQIITNRNIINRAKSVMPYLYYDSNNAYMVVDKSGNLYWVIDAYTTSNEYPFSQKTQFNDLTEVNYVRNSAKVIINAYDGKMKFYITDRNDPIVMAYNKMFPGVFADESDTIPEDIEEHLVYPKKIYDIQAKILQTHHDIESEVLYRGNDIWKIANKSTTGKSEQIKSYYAMCNVDGENRLCLVIPYSNLGKQNLTSYVIGYLNNGKEILKVYKFSSNSNVLGLEELETQINQDETISKEIATLSTTGTSITKNISVIPVENTLLYVQTYYQEMLNESSQKPTLKKVVVSSGNKIAIGNNLDEALQNLLSKNAVDIEIVDNENVEDLINAIVKANQNVKNSFQSGDWKLYGEDMQTMTNLINQLQTVVEAKKKEEASKAKTDPNSINEVNENNTNY